MQIIFANSSKLQEIKENKTKTKNSKKLIFTLGALILMINFIINFHLVELASQSVPLDSSSISFP